MKVIGILVAGALLLFVLSDIWYVTRAWIEFSPHDVIRHIQFQAISLLVCGWYFWMARRAWQNNWRTHVKLTLSFSLLVTLTLTYLLIWPAFEHEANIEGFTSIYSLVFLCMLLVFGISTLFWSWRVSMPNLSLKRDA